MRDQVDWAGIPINLDFAFSQQQCDKVYAQHLMRKRGAQLWRWLHDGAPPCVCETAGQERRFPSTAERLTSG
jgi:sulfite reductase alpha subunit-like flavoprotein